MLELYEQTQGREQQKAQEESAEGTSGSFFVRVLRLSRRGFEWVHPLRCNSRSPEVGLSLLLTLPSPVLALRTR